MKDGLEVFYKVPVLAFQSWLWTFFAQMFCITLCVFQKTRLFFFCRYFGGINVRYHYKWVKRLLKCHFWSFLPFIKAAILVCYPNINMSPPQGSPGMVSSLIMEVKSYWLLLFAVKHFLSVTEKAAGILPAEVNNTEHCGAVDTVVCFCRSFINIYVREAEWKQTEVKAISSTVLLLPPHYLSGFTRKHTHTRIHLWGLMSLEASLSEKNVWSHHSGFIAPIMIQHLLLPPCVISGRALLGAAACRWPLETGCRKVQAFCRANSTLSFHVFITGAKNKALNCGSCG